MLFSAGTFLYVATVHVLPELVSFLLPASSYPNSGQGVAYQFVGFLGEPTRRRTLALGRSRLFAA